MSYGIWKPATAWDSAREFVIDNINNAQGLSALQRQDLLEIEISLYEEFYKSSSASGWYEGAISYYSDEEIRNDIYRYAVAFFSIIENGDYPDQFKKVFASYADTTFTVKNEAKEYQDQGIETPKWVWVALAGAVYWMWKK